MSPVRDAGLGISTPSHQTDITEPHSSKENRAIRLDPTWDDISANQSTIFSTPSDVYPRPNKIDAPVDTKQLAIELRRELPIEPLVQVEKNPGMERFNELTSEVLLGVYEGFPRPVDFSASELGATHNVEPAYVIDTLEWLKQEGYVTLRTSGSLYELDVKDGQVPLGFRYGVGLTSKGLAILSFAPDSLKPHESLAHSLKEAAKETKKEVAKEALKEIVKHIVTLGTKVAMQHFAPGMPQI